MKEANCNYCGSPHYEKRTVEYLYSYKGKYLLVPNTPVEVCLDCGMMYYEGAVIEEIERHFFAIHDRAEEPDSCVEVPVKAYSSFSSKNPVQST